MRPTRCIRILSLVSCFEFIAPCTAASLSTELARRSTGEGMGVAHLYSPGQLEVIYFDKSGPTSIRIPQMQTLYDIESQHGALLVSSQGLPQSVDEWIRRPPSALLEIISLDGKPIRLVGMNRWPRIAVLSPTLQYVAAAFVDTRLHRAVLRYGNTAWNQIRDVYTLNLGTDPEDPNLNNYRQENFSWSPDDKFLAHSGNGAVYIFDVQSRGSSKIGDGSDPCWSLDGQSIAFRSPSHDLMLYSVLSKRTDRLTSGIDVVGFPRWSPDSRYILFTKNSAALALRNPLTMPATEFMVMRLEDRATAPVYTPAMGLDNRRFYWIVTGRR